MAEIKDFEKVAMPHLDAVVRVALALCGNRAQADDLAQSTFLKAFQKFRTFTPGTKCKAWLMRILRNTWIDQLRRNRLARETAWPEENLPAEPDTSQQSVWSDPREILEAFSDEQVIGALMKLPGDQRLCLLLGDVEGFSQQEVAEVLDVAVGTVKSRTSRARAALKKSLAAHAEDLGITGR